MTARTMQATELPQISPFSLSTEPVVAPSSELWGEGRFLVQSPYTEVVHRLDLDTLDHENTILARALCHLRSVRDDYATAPYIESFNWPEVINQARKLVAASGKGFEATSFYVVAFRSQIKPSTEHSQLGELDKAAHAEAVASGGFLKYWYGCPDPELRNLATCVWRCRQDAMDGGRGPACRKATSSSRTFYATWKIDQYRLTIRESVQGWDIVPWSE